MPLHAVAALMSEQGWQAFLAAEGVSDWVVLPRAATAVFTVASLGEPARLAAALAAGRRVVDDSHAPEYWILADRAGNRACIAAWQDGGTATPAANHDTP
jgi:hypothetical protein